MTSLPNTFSVNELIMRPPVEADRPTFMKILNVDASIAQWTTIPFPYTDSDFDHFLGDDEDKYVIERDGLVVGSMGARPDWETGTAKFGYWLAPDGRGAGVVTRAGSRLCSLLFDCGTQRIVAEVVVGNLASGAALNRIGFTLEGIARSVHAGSCGLEAQRIDMQIWSLLPGEIAPAA